MSRHPTQPSSYLDPASPYAYLASHRVDELTLAVRPTRACHGKTSRRLHSP